MSASARSSRGASEAPLETPPKDSIAAAKPPLEQRWRGRAPRRPRHLFLYGTLMRGQPAHRLIAGRAAFVEEGHVIGTLLALGRFPGLVKGRGRVRGEVWRLDTPEVLRTLDEYEGYNFERCTTLATLASGRRVRAMVYRYRGPRTREEAARVVARERRSTQHIVEQIAVIPEGDWRRHRWR